MDEKLSFEQYYEEYYSQVLKYIIKKTSNFADAEDLAMESFVACYRRFTEFNPEKASFATWLYVVVNNKIKNYYRDCKCSDELDDELVSSINLEDEIIASEYLAGLRRELALALKTLSETHRKIVILKYFQNKTSKEIADAMGLTPVNVRVNLSRSVDRLQKYFLEKNIYWEN